MKRGDKLEMELLFIYYLSIEKCAFQKTYVGHLLNKQPNSVLVIWVEELKRTKRLGVSYDWRTLLNSHVMEQIKEQNKDVSEILKVIS